MRATMIDRREVTSLAPVYPRARGIVNRSLMKLEGASRPSTRACLCKRHGAAVVVMAFDEGTARSTPGAQGRTCKRPHDILRSTAGFPPKDIFIFMRKYLRHRHCIEEHNNYVGRSTPAPTSATISPHARELGRGVQRPSRPAATNLVREAIHLCSFNTRSATALILRGCIVALEIYDEIPVEASDRVTEDVVLPNRTPEATEVLFLLAIAG